MHQCSKTGEHILKVYVIKIYFNEFIRSIRIIEKLCLSDQFKQIKINVVKYGYSYCATVCISGYKTNHGV